MTSQTTPSPDMVLGMYLQMVLIRRFEDHLYRLFLQGLVPGTLHQYQGQEAIDIGLAQYLVEGSSMDKARELARHTANNLPLTNFAICSAISHMQNMSGLDAAYAEACVAGVVNTQPAARERLEAFANKTAARVRPNS